MQHIPTEHYRIKDCKRLIYEVCRMATDDYEKAELKIRKGYKAHSKSKRTPQQIQDEIFDFFIYWIGFDNAWEMVDAIEQRVTKILAGGKPPKMIKTSNIVKKKEW